MSDQAHYYTLMRLNLNSLDLASVFAIFYIFFFLLFCWNFSLFFLFKNSVTSIVPWLNVLYVLTNLNGLTGKILL